MHNSRLCDIGVSLQFVDGYGKFLNQPNLMTLLFIALLQIIHLIMELHFKRTLIEDFGNFQISIFSQNRKFFIYELTNFAPN